MEDIKLKNRILNVLLSHQVNHDFLSQDKCILENSYEDVVNDILTFVNSSALAK